jgi:hypothetical protein
MSAKAMEWGQIWRTLFCGWDGDIDLAALAAELRTPRASGGDEVDAAAWVCEQIQEAY